MFKQIPKSLFIVPAIVLAGLLVLVSIHLKTEVFSKVVSAKVLFEVPPDAKEIAIDGYYSLSSLVNSLADTSLSLSSFQIDENLTTIDELKKVADQVKLEFTPLDDVFYEIKIFDNKEFWLNTILKIPQNKTSVIGLTWEIGKGDDEKQKEVRFHPQHHELKKHLGQNAALAPITQISFRAEKIKIKFRGAVLKCDNLKTKTNIFTKKIVGEFSIGGTIKERASDIIFKSAGTKSIGTIHFNLPIPVDKDAAPAKKDERKRVGHLSIEPTKIRNPKFLNFKQGIIKLYKNIFVDLKDEKDKSSLSIKGDVLGDEALKPILIHDLGIETEFRIKTKDVRVNKEQKQINWLEWLWTNKILISFMGFLVWLIDKIIGFYGPIWTEKIKEKWEKRKKLKEAETEQQGTTEETAEEAEAEPENDSAVPEPENQPT